MGRSKLENIKATAIVFVITLKMRLAKSKEDYNRSLFLNRGGSFSSGSSI